MDSIDKRIPIAYVTKWATTRGILVVRDAEASEGGYLYTGFVSVSRTHWTTDKAVAEGRWRDAVKKAAALAQANADRLRAMANGAPKYEER